MAASAGRPSCPGGAGGRWRPGPGTVHHRHGLLHPRVPVAPPPTSWPGSSCPWPGCLAVAGGAWRAPGPCVRDRGEPGARADHPRGRSGDGWPRSGTSSSWQHSHGGRRHRVHPGALGLGAWVWWHLDGPETRWQLFGAYATGSGRRRRLPGPVRARLADRLGPHRRKAAPATATDAYPAPSGTPHRGGTPITPRVGATERGCGYRGRAFAVRTTLGQWIPTLVQCPAPTSTTQ